MSDTPTNASPTADPGTELRALIPSGEFGVRGRELSLEERARILDELFFEDDRRVPYLWRFATLIVLSSSIAGLGLLNDSGAVVIGAMLVAPLMTPILGLAAATVQAWTARQLESLAIIASGALLAVAVGWIAVRLLPEVDEDVTLPGELLARTAPNLLDLGIALAAGAAGGYVLVRKEAGSALPGVGIAVALVPPLVTVGVTLGLGRTDLTDGALLLFLTNLACITLAAGLVFSFAGFVPRLDRVFTRRGRWVSFTISGVVVLAVAIPLAAYTAIQWSEGRTRDRVDEIVAEWDPTLTLDAVEVDHSASPLAVSIAVSGPEQPGDPDTLAALLSDQEGEDVAVSIRYTQLLTGNQPNY
jgi:uncharacterized hydrophobic protein (TIGR00271 family)